MVGCMRVALGILFLSLLTVPYGCRQESTAPAGESLKSLRGRADQGDAKAQYNLGLRYDQGRGVPQDYAEAIRWYRKAAEQGDAGAQFVLGLSYKLGQVVAQDYVNAHMWINLAASHATGDKQKKFAKGRDRLAGKMTPAQVAEAQALARN